MSKIVNKKNSNITYYIDENKRTVVAKLTNCKYDVQCLVEKLLNDSNNSIFSDVFVIDYDFKNKLLLKDVYYGKAKCYKSDTWDEKRGMRIARSRMLAKYYNDALKITSKIITDTTDFANNMAVVSSSLDKQLKKYITDINTLTKEDV